MEERIEEKMQFAVLIDAENISSKYVSVIFDELEKYGFASCRRIYGNWSKENNWKEETLLEYSIIPIQQFSYTMGKNSTDMVMVIDAMDLLYQNKVDGFCLVTSDSDFTRLAMRLREEKKYVLGMGESKTPLALTRACNRFVHLNLIGEAAKDENLHDAGNVIQEADEDIANVTSLENIENAIWMLLNENGGEKLDLGFVGRRLSERFPDFDVRNYGYSKLGVFITSELPHFRVFKDNNVNYIAKGQTVEKELIEQAARQILAENGGCIENLSVMNEKLKKKYSGFNIKDYGFSRISSFLRSFNGFVVDNNTISLKEKETKKAGIVKAAAKKSAARGRRQGGAKNNTHADTGKKQTQ